MCAPEGTRPPSGGSAGGETRERNVTIDVDELLYTQTVSIQSNLDIGPPGASTPFPTTQSETLASTILGARFAFGHVQVESEIPFVVASNGPTSFGDVAFGAYYARDFDSLRFRVGGVLSLPTAPTDVVMTTYGTTYGTYSYAVTGPGLNDVLFSRGLDRTWLWVSHYFAPLAPSARLSSTAKAVFQHATEVVVAPLMGTDSGAQAILAMQLSEELGVHAGLFRGGVRAELVGLVGLVNTGAPGNSVGAFSVMPFAGIGGAAGFVDLGALVNLVDPISFDLSGAQPSWGLRLRGGVHF